MLLFYASKDLKNTYEALEILKYQDISCVVVKIVKNRDIFRPAMVLKQMYLAAFNHRLQCILSFACSVSTHILASHSAAGHLEVVLSVVLWVKRVLGAGVKQRPHRLVILKHQINVA